MSYEYISFYFIRAVNDPYHRNAKLDKSQNRNRNNKSMTEIIETWNHKITSNPQQNIKQLSQLRRICRYFNLLTDSGPV